jgi:hypothetical protein
VSDETPPLQKTIEPPPERRPSRLRRLAIPVLIYLVSLGAYLAASGSRLKRPTEDNHYVYLADNLLHGRLKLDGAPPHQNDWALVHELVLNDGRRVRGTFLQTGGTGRFKTTRGERLVVTDDMIRSREYVYYVSFPWFPAILMMPFVAIWRLRFNDVIFTCILAAFNPMLIYFVLRRLAALKLSLRSLADDLWLTAAFAFGTVLFFSSVLGQVWFTAHVIGVGLTALYVLAALAGRHLLLAGLFLGLGFVTRTPILFLCPFVVGEILRRNLRPPSAERPALSGPDPSRRPEMWPWLRGLVPRVDWARAIPQILLAALPAGAILGLALVYNYLCFDNPLMFGHYYLNVIWAERIQRWGLFNYHYLPRNLSVMFTLLPQFKLQHPYVQFSWHGMSVFLSTPLYLFLLWPVRRSPLQPWLYLSCFCAAIAHLLYQNSGWVQFGYRFILDYQVLLFALLAVGGRRFGLLAKALIVFSVALNTFGAVTFNRAMEYYWDGMFPIP